MAVRADPSDRARIEWPMVGRQQELDFVARALAGPRRGVLLAGAPGVGKTRLAREALAGAAERGWLVSMLAATSATSGIPLGALAHLLPRDTGPTRHSAQLLARVADALVERTGPGCAVVAVDDAHLLDDLSAAFVHHLATTGQAPLIITTRSGEPTPVAITSLYKDGLVDRLEVQQLAREEVRELLCLVLGGDVAEHTLSELWTASAGNVLYLRELVLDALDAGTLASAEGIWRWSGGVGPATRLNEVVGARLSGLDPAEREVLELLALGEPFEAGILERLARGARLDELERRGLVEIRMADRRAEARLSHPLYGEVLRSRLGGYQRRRLFRMLADHMESTGSRRPTDVFRLSLWRVESGTAHDAGRLAAAAEHANRIHDPVTAEQLARASLQLEAGFAASLQLGAALVEQARFEEAEAVLAALAPESTDDAGRQGLAYYRMRALFYGLGRPDEAESAVAAIEEAMSGGGPGRTLRGWRAMMLSHAGRFAAAAELAGDLVASDDPGARLVGLPAIAVARMLEGRVDEAVKVTDECVAGAGPDRPLPVLVASLRILALAADGRLAEAEQVAAGLAPAGCTGRRKPGDDAVVDTLRGHLCLRAGRPQSALRLLRQAAAVLRDYDSGGFLGWCLSQQVEAAALVGDVDTARSALADATSLRSSGVRMFDGASARARSWYRGAEASWSAAAAELSDVAERLAGSGELSEAVRAMHDAVRLGAGPAAVRRLLELTGLMDGGFAAAVALHAAALSADDAALLEQAADAFESAGCTLLAAEAAAEAAAAASSAGLSRRAVAALRRSEALASVCEGARTPSLARSDSPGALTRREREVAGLAAVGLSNREIADRLFASVRTVESHLQQAYSKLGVNSRRSLAEALSGGPAPGRT